MTLLSSEAQTELSSLDVFSSQVKSRGGNPLAHTLSCVFANAALCAVDISYYKTGWQNSSLSPCASAPHVCSARMIRSQPLLSLNCCL